MSQNLKAQFDEAIVRWQSTLGSDKVTADDFGKLLACFVTMLVTDAVRTMMQQGKTRDEINAKLQTDIMPGMVKFQRDALGVFNGALNDLTAPSLSLN